MIKPGILNLPGSTLSSKQTVEKLLTKDFDTHHCYFNERGFHNHLSHHILAAYDLGASKELLEAVWKEEEKMQRPILLEGVKDDDVKGGVTPVGEIKEGNWREYLGEQKSYAALLHFFGEEVKKLGAVDTVEKYIFSSGANENGTEMLIRLVSGALHPFIQLGYAAEFGSDPALVSAALAQAAIHKYSDTGVEAFRYVPPSSGAKKLPLLQVLGEYLHSDILKPVMPYKPEGLFNERLRDAFGEGTQRSKEIARICSLWDLPDNGKFTEEDLERVVEEAIWFSTLNFAGTSKKGRKPRLDFFLMHGLTSSLFIRSLCKNLVKNPESQVRLIRHWLAVILIVSIVRGRPQVDGNVVMGYTDRALPPNFRNVVPQPSDDAVPKPGDGVPEEGVNPWGVMVQSALRAPDSHTVKSLRTLLYGAVHYGTRGVGEVRGALDGEGKEVLKGLGEVDGTVFVRAAGVLMNTMGWVDWGMKEGSWDRSAIGWDEAWDVSDDKAGVLPGLESAV